MRQAPRAAPGATQAALCAEACGRARCAGAHRLSRESGRRGHCATHRRCQDMPDFGLDERCQGERRVRGHRLAGYGHEFPIITCVAGRRRNGHDWACCARLGALKGLPDAEQAVSRPRSTDTPADEARKEKTFARAEEKTLAVLAEGAMAAHPAGKTKALGPDAP